MIQSSEHITCLAAWQSHSWDMRGKRNMGWNSMWSCTIPAADFLMLIYGHIHYKHRSRPARTCSPGTRWKESLVQIQISHTRRLEVALIPKCRVWLATAKVAPLNTRLFQHCQNKQLFLFFLLNDQSLVLPPSRRTFPLKRTCSIIFFHLAAALKLEPFIEKSNQPFQTKTRWVTLFWSLLCSNLQLSHLISRVVKPAC